MHTENPPPSVEADGERLLDLKEVAQILGGISERSVRRLIAKAELPQAVKVLSSPKLYLSDIRAYLERLKIKREKQSPRH